MPPNHHNTSATGAFRVFPVCFWGALVIEPANRAPLVPADDGPGVARAPAPVVAVAGVAAPPERRPASPEETPSAMSSLTPYRYFFRKSPGLIEG